MATVGGMRIAQSVNTTLTNSLTQTSTSWVVETASILVPSGCILELFGIDGFSSINTGNADFQHSFLIALDGSNYVEYVYASSSATTNLSSVFPTTSQTVAGNTPTIKLPAGARIKWRTYATVAFAANRTVSISTQIAYAIYA